MTRHPIRWSSRYVPSAHGLSMEIYCTVCDLPTSYIAFRKRDGTLVDFPVHDDPKRLAKVRGVPA